jgi:hypothetical protein
MMPFDRYGRTRVAQRTGIGLLQTLSNTDPVRLLHVASSAGSPAIGAPSFSYSEPFTYTNGNLTGQGGWADDSGGDPSMVIASNVATGNRLGRVQRQSPSDRSLLTELPCRGRSPIR